MASKYTTDCNIIITSIKKSEKGLEGRPQRPGRKLAEVLKENEIDG